MKNQEVCPRCHKRLSLSDKEVTKLTALWTMYLSTGRPDTYKKFKDFKDTLGLLTCSIHTKKEQSNGR